MAVLCLPIDDDSGTLSWSSGQCGVRWAGVRGRRKKTQKMGNSQLGFPRTKQQQRASAYVVGRAPRHVTHVLIDESVEVIEVDAFGDCLHLVQPDTHDGIRE
eukprot:scaffold9856_cov129-Skeletonema_marinoi.AAC.3